jgi:hypothetical protein
MSPRQLLSSLGIVIVLGILVWISGLAVFPTSEYIRGFARAKGVPVHGEYDGRRFYGAIPDILQICRRDPLCVGVSDRRYFASVVQLKRGTPVNMEQGLDEAEYAYIKDEFPTIFL